MHVQCIPGMLQTMTGYQVLLFFIYDVDAIILLYMFVVVNGFYDLESFTSDLAKFVCLIVHGHWAELSCATNDNHGSLRKVLGSTSSFNLL